MKIIILHGEDINKSYERLKKFIDEAKRRDWEILYDDLSITPSLFGADRLTVIRDYKLINAKALKSLSKIPGTLVFYHEDVLPQTFLKLLPTDVKKEEFKLPKLIWTFLDSLYPKNSAKSIKLFHEIIQRDPPEFVFSLISKLFRDLYWVKVDPKSVPYPSWRTSKLKVQSSKCSEEQLVKIIDTLAKIDVDVKTGKAYLVSSLDLLILKQLE